MASIAVASGDGDERERICAVTGGRGFAARHLVARLIESERWSQVRIADLAPCITIDDADPRDVAVLAPALQSGRAVYFSADLRNISQVIAAFQGVSVVFHMAAPDSSINNFNLHYSVTVQGTKNVINACVECKVEKLIYTSSPSVVFDGVHGIYNGDESLPYPDKHNDVYSETKAQAEALVLQANGKAGLLTCAIRPSSIFGPGDKLLVPSLVSAARAGKSKFIIGDGENVYDFTYVENVAHAHICAEQTLNVDKVGSKDDPAGKAYFVTNMEPIKFWEFISTLLEGLGYQRPKTRIPAKVIMPIACLVEFIYKKLGPYGMPVPQLTPSRVRLLSCSRTFDSSRAQNLIGYDPIVSLKDGIERTIQSYSHLRAEASIVKSRNVDKPSKAYQILMNETVAHVLLWRDEKHTVSILAVLITLLLCCFRSGYTFLSLTAFMLLVLTVVLFLYSFLPPVIFGYTIKRIPPHMFQLSEETIQCMTESVAQQWNSGVNIFKNLSEGKDWMLFLKTMVLLLLIKFLGAFSLQNLMFSGLVFMFSAFYIYEQKEEEIDNILTVGAVTACRHKEAILTKLRGK